MKTNTAIVGGNVTGNIGSCKIESTGVDVSSFYKYTVAVNSCTGEVVSKSEVYFDSSWLVIPVLVFTIIFSLIAGIKWATY